MPEPLTFALLAGVATVVAGYGARQVRKAAQREAAAARRPLERARYLAGQMEQRAGHRSRQLLAKRAASLFWLCDRAQQAWKQAGLKLPEELSPLGRSWAAPAQWKSMAAQLHARIRSQGPLDHWLNSLIAGSILARALRAHWPKPEALSDTAGAQAVASAEWLDSSAAVESGDGAAFTASLGAGSLRDLMLELPASVTTDLAADWAFDGLLEVGGPLLDMASGAFAPLALLRAAKSLQQADDIRAQVPKLKRGAQQTNAHSSALAKLCTSLRERELAEEEAAYAVYKAAMQLEALHMRGAAEPPTSMAAAAASLQAATRRWWLLVTQQPTPGAGAEAAPGRPVQES